MQYYCAFAMLLLVGTDTMERQGSGSGAPTYKARWVLSIISREFLKANELFCDVQMQEFGSVWKQHSRQDSAARAVKAMNRLASPIGPDWETTATGDLFG